MQQLKDLISKRLGTLEEVTNRFPVENRLAYAQWLAQTYYFVCHSTRLLALAASLFPQEKNSFHYRFAEHIKDEKSHELMALSDLKKLGYKIEDFPELSETSAFYQSQYFWIERVNPLSFYGYILCLEVFSIRGAVRLHDIASKEFGKDAAVFLRVHTKEDVDHVDEAFKHLENLSDKDLSLIAKNFAMSCDLYQSMYERMISLAEEGLRSKKAS